MMSTNFKFYFDKPMEETKGNSTPDSLFTVVTGFPHSYGVSPQFLQPFSIDSADFPCRDPAISSPRSFYGQNICSVGWIYWLSWPFSQPWINIHKGWVLIIAKSWETAFLVNFCHFMQTSNQKNISTKKKTIVLIPRVSFFKRNHWNF